MLGIPTPKVRLYGISKTLNPKGMQTPKLAPGAGLCMGTTIQVEWLLLTSSLPLDDPKENEIHFNRNLNQGTYNQYMTPI